MSKKYDVDNIVGNEFMDESEREFFEKYAEAIERQEKNIGEQHEMKIGSSELDKLLVELEEEENKKEYVVQGALLWCDKSIMQKRTLSNGNETLESIPVGMEYASRIQVDENRVELIGDLVPACVDDYIGGLRGKDTIKNDQLNIHSFGNCSAIKEKAELDQLIEMAGMGAEKKEEIIKAIDSGWGTCYCFMQLKNKWENLALVGEYMTGEMDNPIAIINKKYLLDPSYMKFNGKEGINMMSMLFCDYGGGIITAQESGQNSNVCNNIGFGYSTIMTVISFEGNVGLRVNGDGSLTIGYGYDFTKESDPDTFDRYFYIDTDGNIQKKRELEDNEAFDTVRLAAEQKKIIEGVDSFISGKGYGNQNKPLVFNQNQYDALFSFVYSMVLMYFRMTLINHGRIKGVKVLLEQMQEKIERISYK